MAYRRDNVWTVYGLADQFGVVRYIGKTCSQNERLKAHITSARSGGAVTPAARWIRNLLSCGVRPTMQVIETYQTEAESFAGEVKWITQFKKRNGRYDGNQLCNISAGGLGGLAGMKHPPMSAERRLRLSIAKTGKPGYRHTAESKAKIGAANLGNVKTLEMRQQLAYAKTRYTKEQDAAIFEDRKTMSMSKVAKKWGVSIGCIHKCERRHKRSMGVFAR